MRKKLLRLIEAVAFCALLAAVIVALTGLVERKESRAKLTPFFQRAQDIDVLFLGSSHVLNAVYPMELWNDYGITSYNFGVYNCTLPVSYWTMRSALDVCAPKLVVVDVDDVGRLEKLSQSSADMHTALDALPLNLTKIRAIEDLMDDPALRDEDGRRYADLKGEYYFTLSLYHERWSGLTKDDVSPALNAQLGADMVVGVAQPAEYEILADIAPEEGWGFVYLRRIVEECAQRGIQVLLVNVPYPPAIEDDPRYSSMEDQRYANTVYEIAQELGVEFIDFVYMDQVVDYATDCYDPASHLNPSGARKVTDYLGRFIADVYGIEDHRGDARFESWDADYDAYADLKLERLAQQSELAEFLMLLHDGGLSACVIVSKDCALYGNETLLRLLQNAARQNLFEEDTFEGLWADSLFPLEALDAAAARGEADLAVIDRGTGGIAEAVGDGERTIDASFGQVRYSASGSQTALSVARGDGTQDCFAGESGAVRVAVIDDRTGDVVMTRAFGVQ